MKQHLERPIERVAYSVKEAAEAVGLCARTMYDLVRTGNVKTARYGRKIIIRKSDLQAFVDKCFDEQHAS